MISGERAKWRDVRLVPQVFNKGIKYIIIAQKSSFIKKGSLVQFGKVKIFKKYPKKLREKNCWTLLYRGSTGVTHWGWKGVAPGVKRGGASQCATLYDPPLFEKKRSKEVAPLLTPSVPPRLTPGTKWSDNTLLILFDNFDHSALYHTSFLYEIRPFHLFPRRSL